MKNIITFFFLLLSFSVSAQEIISETKEIIQIDSLYFLKTKKIVENGTPYPNVSVDTVFIGDSTQTVNTLFDVPYQLQIEVAEGMRKALKRNFATQIFNQINPMFQALTGKTLYQDAGRRFFGSLAGRYRVFRQNGTNFFANITQVASGALRLVGENGEGTFVLNALGPDAFLLMNFDHDQIGGGENFYFFWDGESSDRKTFWPAERVSGRTTIFRIVKVSQ